MFARLLSASIAILFSAQLCLAEEFDVTSKGTGFSMVGDFKGSITKNSSEVKVRLREGEILCQPCSTPKRKLISLRAMLVEWTSDRRTFRIVAMSPPLPFNKMLSVGESFAMAGEKMEIPVRGLSASQLKQTWLCFSIAVDSMREGSPSIGTCYTHAKEYLGGGDTGFGKKEG